MLISPPPVFARGFKLKLFIYKAIKQVLTWTGMTVSPQFLCMISRLIPFFSLQPTFLLPCNKIKLRFLFCIINLGISALHLLDLLSESLQE